MADPIAQTATPDVSELVKIGPLPRQMMGDTHEVEIVDMKADGNMLEVFVRAWDQKVAVGFGPDGTVEIERIRIFNPPMTVPDGTTRFNTLPKKFDEKGNELPSNGPIEIHNVKKDPESALRDILSNILRAKQDKTDDVAIITGKVGTTTSVFYCDTNPESTSTNGYCDAQRGTFTYATYHGYTDADSSDHSASNPYIFSGLTTGFLVNWGEMTRGFALFDTSALGAGVTVTSATLTMTPIYLTDYSDPQSVSICGSTPASSTAIVNADYDQLGTTKFASDVAIAALTVDTAHDFALNASGLAAISKTGVTKLGVRFKSDLENAEPTRTGSAAIQGIFYSSNAGSHPPFLTVVTSAAAVGGNFFFGR